MKKRALLFLFFLSLSYWLCDENRRTEYLCHDNHFEEYQQGVIDHSITGPLAYRVLMPFTIRLFSRAVPGLPEIEIDFYLNLLLVLLIQIAFFRYLKNFLPGASSLAGTLWLDLCILMGFASFMGMHVYETSDLCNLLFMILAMQSIYKGSWAITAALLFTAMFNRETPAFLLLPLFLMWQDKKVSTRHLLICTASVLTPYFLLKLLIHPPEPAWFLTVFLEENIPFYKTGNLDIVLAGYFKFLVFTGPAFLLAFIRFKDKKYFLKTASWAVLPFIPVHILVGHVEEYRMWMPLFLFLIPLGMETPGNIFEGKLAKNDEAIN